MPTLKANERYIENAPNESRGLSIDESSNDLPDAVSTPFISLANDLAMSAELAMRCETAAKSFVIVSKEVLEDVFAVLAV